MHIVFFGDQHLESLGGAQVSMRLQKTHLERAGHTVTVIAPRMHGKRARTAAKDDAGPTRPEAPPDAPAAGGVGVGNLDLPSIPITPDREYSMTWPGRRTDRWLDAAMRDRPPVDLVHVQADFWGAFIGHRFAARHGLPVVHTMHNRVDVGIEATAPFPGLVMRVLNAWERRALDGDGEAKRLGRDGWAYLRRLAERSDAVTAPSAHFARRLEQYGVFPRVDVIWNGIDDEIRADVLATSPLSKAGSRPHFVWLGRMSPEKRLLPFLEAVALSGVDADIEVIGGGGQLRAAERLVAKLRPVGNVVFAGRLPYADVLRRIAAADAVVQTSIGFETQGMTVFEAATLGTPAVVSDPDIAGELESGFWPVADGTVPALAVSLRAAAADIVAGRAAHPNPGVAERFLQSSRTAAMIEVYERALARHR